MSPLIVTALAMLSIVVPAGARTQTCSQSARATATITVHADDPRYSTRDGWVLAQVVGTLAANTPELAHIALGHVTCREGREAYQRGGRREVAADGEACRAVKGLSFGRDAIVATMTLLLFVNRGDDEDGTRRRARELNATCLSG